MASAIAQLLEFGQSPWYDNLTRALATGGLDELMREHGIRGVTSNPTIFEKAMAVGHRLRRAAARARRARARRPKTRTGSSCSPTSRTRPTGCGPSTTSSTAPTASCRSRCRRTSRTTPTATIAQAKELWRAARPAQRDDQDPGHAGRHPGDHGGARRRPQRQRHVDLQPRPVSKQSSRRSWQGLERSRRARRRPSTAARRSRRSSSAGSTPRPTAGCPTIRRCAARPRSPTPSSRTRSSSRSSAARAGTARRRRARACSGRCGRRRRRRTRRTPPRSTSTS